ncbi:MAG: helix-turn-helix domain-containing protein, partial [Pseudomonadota bacterium]
GRLCPVTYCVSVIGGKWKPVILFLITNGINRFGEMQRKIDGISKQMLTKQLRELEAAEIIRRKVYAEIPPRVEYFITDKGTSIMPVIHAMRAWGEAYLPEMDQR